MDAPDEEGSEHPSLADAREKAARNLRFTLSESMKEHGRIVLDHRIDIEDADGNVLDTVYGRDVVIVREHDA